jgi:hypothetical protein
MFRINSSSRPSDELQVELAHAAASWARWRRPDGCRYSLALKLWLAIGGAIVAMVATAAIRLAYAGMHELCNATSIT